METINAELISGEGKKDQRGRRLMSEARWAELLQEYENSSETQAAYCKRNSINVHTFVARLAKSRREKPLAGVRAQAGFVEANISNAWLGTGNALEVVLPDGILIRGGDIEAMAKLVRAIQGRS